MLPKACFPESPFGGHSVGNLHDDQGFRPDCWSTTVEIIDVDGFLR